jgi:glycosyltransferase involved in cell wall biosynthesis
MTTRIVFLVPDLDAAGDLSPLHVLLEGLPPEQYDLHVVSFSRGAITNQPEESASHEWTTINRRSQSDPVAWWQFRSYLRRLQPQIIHLWQPFDFAWTTLLTDILHRGTLAVSLQDPFPRLIEHPNLPTQLICKRPYQFITSTACLRDRLVEAGITDQQCAVIPSAVPLPRITSGHSTQLAELDLPAESRLIGSLNPMQSWKHLQDLIWITAVLKVATDDIHLVMNGHGPQRRRLQKFARQVEIQDHVHWIDDSSHPAQWLPGIDCYVSTTHHLGHSPGILHGMAAALPVAAIDCPGNRELVTPHKHGMLAPGGDCGSLARAVWKLLDDTSLARQLGKQARQHVAQYCTIDQMVHGHHEIYQTLPIGQTLSRGNR